MSKEVELRNDILRLIRASGVPNEIALQALDEAHIIISEPQIDVNTYIESNELKKSYDSQLSDLIANIADALQVVDNRQKQLREWINILDLCQGLNNGNQKGC